MDINLIISHKSGEENQLSRFEKLLPKTKTKQELRDLEMHLLKPAPIPPYKGKPAGQTNFQKRTVLFTFPHHSHIERLKHFFTINTYIQTNTYDVDFIIELIRLMEIGRIKWNPNSKRFFAIKESGQKIRL